MTFSRLFCFLVILVNPLLLRAADYYWVDGGGKWTDISHWATTSGGSVKHFQLPTSNDDIIFDENSFSQPGHEFLINIKEIVCGSMNWQNVTNAPIFKADKEVTLNIFGSLVLSPSIDFQVAGEFVFKSTTTNKTLRTFGNILSSVTFDGLGAWLLLDDLHVNEFVRLEEGAFNLNGFSLRCDNLTSNSVEIRTLDYENASIFAHVIELNQTNMEVLGQGAEIELSGEGSTFVLSGFGDVIVGSIKFLENEEGSRFDILAAQSIIKVEELSSYSDLSLNGKVNIETIFFKKGRSFQFEADSEFTINTLISDADCIERISIYSENFLSRAEIIQLQNLENDFIDFQGVECNECQEFEIPNALDLGGNDGFNFNFHEVEDYFWIGGEGVWSDPMNWSMSSGGISANCIPSANDNVFFDENSFTAVGQFANVDLSAVYMNDLIWKTIPDGCGLQGEEAHKLVVYGSLQLAENMNHNFLGDYYFEARKESDIKSNNLPFKGSIVFDDFDGRSFDANGIVASWNILDNLICEKTIELKSGVVVADDITITSNEFSSPGKLRKTLVLNNSKYVLKPDGLQGSSWNTFGDFKYQGSNSEIDFKGGDRALFKDESGGDGSAGTSYEKITFTDVDGDIDVEFGGLFCQEMVFTQNAVIAGFINTEKLILNAGNKYEFFASQGTGGSQIGEIEYTSDCDEGLIKLFSSRIGAAANVFLNSEITVDNFDITDIAILGSGSLIANNSNDGGRNQNITFSEKQERDLYWVGDGGEWFDSDHWSATSGGPGGECPPTVLDNVFFDLNSFSLNNQVVSNTLSNVANCRQISWSNTTGFPDLKIEELWASGSVILDNSFTYEVEYLFLTSDDVVDVAIDELDLKSIIVNGSGVFNFTSNLTGREFIQYNGECNLENLNIDLEKIYLLLEAEKFNIKGSSVQLSGGNSAIANTNRSITNDGRYYPFYSSAKSKTIEATGSKIDFESNSAGLFIGKTSSLGRVNFLEESGDVRVETPFGSEFKSMLLHGNAAFKGEMVYDSIIFSPGKNYLFDERVIFLVDGYFQMVGHNCAPINFYNTSINKTELSFNENCDVQADFIQMQNIHNLSTTRFAGRFSTDVEDSNTGWTFEEASVVLENGFLGSDRVLCDDMGILLVPFEFIDNTSFLWSDGSSGYSITVEDPGIYFASVIVNELCSITDSIEVFNPEEYDLGLEELVTVCDGGEAVLAANLDDENASFLWSTGAVEKEIEVDEEGFYSIEVSINECLFIYWIEVEENGCFSRDSIEVEFTQPPLFRLGADTLVCENTSVTLSPLFDGITPTWSDGSKSLTLNVDREGTYWAMVQEGGCVVRDSITVNYKSCTDFQVFVPNAFSPNEDGENDLFEIYFQENIVINSFLVEVFDRWGNKIFKSNSPEAKWDGMFLNRPLPMGVYSVMIRLDYTDDFQSSSKLIRKEVAILR